MGDFNPLTPEDPERIGVYLLTGRLSDAAGHTVYLGRLPDQEITRVIRLLPALPGADPQTRERITNRLHAAKRISGAHTAKLVEVGWFDDSPYVVHEHVEGRSLRETVTADGPLDPDALERLASGTLTALTAIHLAGLAHGGLSPDAVVLSAEGPRVRDTALGVSGPEPDYHAPEVVHANLTGGPAPAPGRPADLFAWAATIAYAATGRAPFGGDPQAVLNGSPDLTGLTPALTTLLIACLDKQPQQRPDTKAAMLQLLGDRPALTGTAITGDAVARAVPQEQDAVASQPTVSAGWSAPPLPKETAPAQPPIVLQGAASSAERKKPGGLLLAACVGTVAVLAGAGIWAAGNYTSLNNVEKASADGTAGNPLALVDQAGGRQPYPTNGTGGNGQQGTGDDPAGKVTVPWGATPDPEVPDVGPLNLTTDAPTGEPPVPTLTSFASPPPAVPTVPASPLPPTAVPAPPSTAPTAQPSAKPTEKPSQTAEPTPAHTPTPTVTVTVTPTATPSSPSGSPSASPSEGPTASPSATTDPSPSPSGSPTASSAPSPQPTPTASAAPTRTASPTPTPEPTRTVRPRPTRTAKPEAKPTPERPTEKPITSTPPKPPAEPTPAKPPTEAPKPQANPYTPQQVCGAGFYVQRSASFNGGTVHQLYNSSTGANCVVTMKSTDIGKATPVWATLTVTGGGSKTERGDYKYYAGPVILPAKGKCVSFSGGVPADSASAPPANCG